jgi:uncharacterized membrane protein
MSTDDERNVMSDMSHVTRTEAINEASKWAVGLGMLTMVLAPLSLPILALTVVALLPLLVPLLAVGLIGGILAIPVLAVRGVWRRARGGVSSVSPAGSRPASA